MLRVGITGGIGAGKTLVCKLFNQLGIPVYDSDNAARELMNKDISLKEQLITTFGNTTYIDGVLNRKWLSDLLFKDIHQLQKLNAIVHPAVMKNFQCWEEKQKNVPYIIREAAILFESGTDKDLDHIILVDAPVKVRIQRVQKRDQRSAEEIKFIISNQWSSEKKRTLADTIIENDDHHLIIPQLLFIHQKLLKYCE